MLSDYISYQGKKYPYKTIVISSDDYQSNYILVSVRELEEQLVDKNGVAYNKEAECLDNQIAYYLDSIEELNKSDESILNEIYS